MLAPSTRVACLDIKIVLRWIGEIGILGNNIFNGYSLDGARRKVWSPKIVKLIHEQN